MQADLQGLTQRILASANISDDAAAANGRGVPAGAAGATVAGRGWASVVTGAAVRVACRGGRVTDALLSS
jgi:hypothetical protein